MGLGKDLGFMKINWFIEVCRVYNRVLLDCLQCEWLAWRIFIEIPDNIIQFSATLQSFQSFYFAE